MGFNSGFKGLMGF